MSAVTVRECALGDPVDGCPLPATRDFVRVDRVRVGYRIRSRTPVCTDHGLAAARAPVSGGIAVVHPDTTDDQVRQRFTDADWYPREDHQQ